MTTNPLYGVNTQRFVMISIHNPIGNAMPYVNPGSASSPGVYVLWFYCTLDVRATLNIAFGASFDWLWYPIVGSIHFSQAVLHIVS